MESLALISKARNAVRMLENNECGFDDIQREAAMRTLDYYMTGNSHFTELSARGCIAQMYYYKNDTEKVFAPFIGYKEARGLYDKVKDTIPDYNFWDYAVTINLAYSNHADLVKKWTKDKGKLAERMSELSVSFLCDEDTAHPTDKIFWYMNC